MNTVESIQSNPPSVARFQSGELFRYRTEDCLCEFHEVGERDGDGTSSRAYYLFQSQRGAFVAVTETYRWSDAPVEVVAERLSKRRAIDWALSWSFESKMAAIVGELVSIGLKVTESAGAYGCRKTPRAVGK